MIGNTGGAARWALVAALLFVGGASWADDPGGFPRPLVGLQIQVYAEPFDPGAVYVNVLPLLAELPLGYEASLKFACQASFRFGPEGGRFHRWGAGAGLLWTGLRDLGGAMPAGPSLGPWAGFSVAPDGGEWTLTLAADGSWLFPLTDDGSLAIAVDCQCAQQREFRSRRRANTRRSTR